MLKSKRYILLLLGVLLLIFGSTFFYAYRYSKNYPIPLTSRISLDAKLMFIRDMSNKDKIDTIIMGSSIGLNNVNGMVLEESSKTIKHVLNLSSFSVGISYNKQLLELFSLFPNIKRVIYSAQTLDFTGEGSEPLDIKMIKSYIELDRKSTNFYTISLVFRNFINVVKRRLVWKETYLAHNKFSNLDFDHTGSALLDIYGKDIIQSRWNKTYAQKTNKKSYQDLEEIIKILKGKNIDFYLFVQPYRQVLIQKNKKLRKILNNFHQKSKKITLTNQGHFINLHQKLKLKDIYFADRIHLNDKGSTLIAKDIALYVDKLELIK